MIMMKKFILTLLAIIGFSTCAKAELRIDVTGARFEPMPIAIQDFASDSNNARLAADKISEVVKADLEGTGLFKPLNKQGFIQKFSSVNEKPKFQDWQVINAVALLQGEINEQSDGRLKVSFRLWDTFAGTQMEGKVMTTNADNWRRIAHKIADSVYSRITGEEGYFDTRIVYIAETGPKGNRIKRLAIMDSDGENEKFLTDGSNMVLTPRFSPNMQQVAYLSYYGKQPRVYIYDLQTGKQTVLGDFPGMTFAPRFSPDGQSVIMSMALNGNSDIYTMNLRTKKVIRLTNHPAIDTSPCYSPDGKYITFNSDRSGSQQLYIMDADGKNVKRISFGEGKYATPVWSVRGDYIAFTKILKGKFYIGVMLTDGTGERLIAESYLVEAPTWSPNGRLVAFFGQPSANGKTKIHTIDITGYNEKIINTTTDASDPAWSPILPF